MNRLSQWLGKWTCFWLLAVAMLTACAPARPQRPEQLSYPPLAFQVPAVVQSTLANGVRLYLREDSELPLVQVTAMIGSGALAAPPGLAGFDDLFATTLRTGGTMMLAPAAVEARLDQLAATLACSMGPYTTQLDLSLRHDDLREGLTILADLLRRPAFAADKLELARRQALEAVRRQNDDPGAIAERLLLAALYPGHPLGESPTATTLQAIGRDRLADFHRSQFVPANLWLAVSGDVRQAEVLSLLEELFGTWSGADPPVPALPPLVPPTAGLLQAVVKDVPQSTILIGDLGMTKDHPDQYAARVLNFILGGGDFNSRLMRQIRSDRGLAYSAWSQFQIGRRYPGPVMAGTETKNASAVAALGLIRSIMGDLRTAPVTPDELRIARDSLVNSFIFGFTDPHAVVVQRMQLAFFDYPPDYLARYRERIAAVTAADVQRVARDYLRPERQQVIVVGAPDESTATLESAGLPVRRLTMDELRQ
jgi:zinc protease